MAEARIVFDPIASSGKGRVFPTFEIERASFFLTKEKSATHGIEGFPWRKYRCGKLRIEHD
jgi:hypothetical protein